MLPSLRILGNPWDVLQKNVPLLKLLIQKLNPYWYMGTDSYSYVPYDLWHPNPCHESFPYSWYCRLKRTISKHGFFTFFLENVSSWLITVLIVPFHKCRGFPKSWWRAVYFQSF